MASNIDFITLENLQSKLPRWNPNSSSHLYALVDMGSNGIRFTISDLTPPRTRLLRCIYRERAGISLFDALDDSESGDGQLSFSAATIRKVSLVVGRFRSIALSYGVPLQNIAVFATEAMRRASNAGDMLDAFHEVAPGVAVFVLAPQIEALFGAMGARSTFAGVKGLLLDLGGGSVQMSYMDTTYSRTNTTSTSYEVAAAQHGESLPFGAAKLIKIYNDKDASVKKATTKEVADKMLAVFARLSAKFPDLARAARKEPGNAGVDVFLCGGGFRGYGSMLMHNDPIQPYPVPLIGNYCVPGAFFADTKRMSKVNKSFKGKIYGMSKRRRQQFPAIIAVVDALVSAVPQIASITFCAGGNREGVLMMKLPLDIRESNPLKIVQLPSPTSSTTITSSSTDHEIVAALAATILLALPSNLSHDDIFASSIVYPLIPHIWDNVGEASGAGAAAALHTAINAFPSQPALGHQARASLALALCTRWGGVVAPTDETLYKNLRELLGGEDSLRCYWAEYLGAVAAVLALLMPRVPLSVAEVRQTVRFESEVLASGTQSELRVKVFVAQNAVRGVELDEVKDRFKVVGRRPDRKGKEQGSWMKPNVQVHELADADDAAVAASGSGEPW